MDTNKKKLVSQLALMQLMYTIYGLVALSLVGSAAIHHAKNNRALNLKLITLKQRANQFTYYRIQSICVLFTRTRQQTNSNNNTSTLWPNSSVRWRMVVRDERRKIVFNHAFVSPHKCSHNNLLFKPISTDSFAIAIKCCV